MVMSKNLYDLFSEYNGELPEIKEEIKEAEKMIDNFLGNPEANMADALKIIYLLGTINRTNRKVKLPSNIGKFLSALKGKGLNPVEAKDEYREGYYGSWKPIEPEVPDDIRAQGASRVAIYIIENFMKQVDDQMRMVPGKRIKDSLCKLIKDEFPNVWEGAQKKVVDIKKRIEKKQKLIKKQLQKKKAHIVPDPDVIYINFVPNGTVHFESEDGTIFVPDTSEVEF